MNYCKTVKEHVLRNVIRKKKKKRKRHQLLNQRVGPRVSMYSCTMYDSNSCPCLGDAAPFYFQCMFSVSSNHFHPRTIPRSPPTCLFWVNWLFDLPASSNVEMILAVITHEESEMKHQRGLQSEPDEAEEGLWLWALRQIPRLDGDAQIPKLFISLLNLLSIQWETKVEKAGGWLLHGSGAGQWGRGHPGIRCVNAVEGFVVHFRLWLFLLKGGFHLIHACISPWFNNDCSLLFHSALQMSCSHWAACYFSRVNKLTVFGSE